MFTHTSAPDGTAPRPLSNRTLLLLASVIVSTLVVCFVWSHVRLFWADELLEFYTDSKPTMAAVIWGQLHAPFSFEPPAFHLLAHALLRIIPSHELAERLPSILALAVSEAVIFVITLRLVGRQSVALVAAVLPFCFVTIHYGPEARVYSILVTFFAIAFLAWQVATSRPTHRAFPLFVLAAALACAMLTHYYGAFLVVPLFGGELARTLQRRRIDWRVFVAFAIGTSFLLLDLPFQRAIDPFRQHYYNTGESSWKMIPFTYLWFFLHFHAYNFVARRLLFAEAVVCLLLFVSITLGFIRLLQRRLRGDPLWVWTALLIATLLPVLNLVVAQFTRAYVPRYSLPAIVGLSVLLPALLLPLPSLHRLSRPAFAVLLLLGWLNGLRAIKEAKVLSQRELAQVQPSSQLGSVSLGLADQHIYIQDGPALLMTLFYAPPELRSRVVAIRSRICELHWNHRDTGAQFLSNMRLTAGIPYAEFDSLRATGKPHLFLLTGRTDEAWLDQELGAEHASIHIDQPLLGGHLLQATLAPTGACSP